MLKAYILKVGFAEYKNPQMILNFPQKDCLSTWKVSRLHLLQSYWRSYPLSMLSHCNILNKNATLTPNSPDFYDLRTFFLSRFMHFFRTFFETEKQNPQTLILLECMVKSIKCAFDCSGDKVFWSLMKTLHWRLWWRWWWG